jgi:glycerophosphoryl diester phosphodiesterase
VTGAGVPPGEWGHRWGATGREGRVNCTRGFVSPQGLICDETGSVDQDVGMLVLAHRGASVAAAENTPEAFALADRLGADGVELDVRRVADGRLLVAHDPLPESLVEIEALGAATFTDVLDACGDRMLVNIEIKNSKVDPGYDPTMAMVAPIIDELRRRGPRSRHRWLISSFSWSTLAVCRELAPDIPTGCLTFDTVTADTVERLAAAGHAALHPWETKLDEELVALCHRHALAVTTWTCNDPDRLEEIAALGVDGVCTDVPDVALTALGRSGFDAEPAWPTISR